MSKLYASVLIALSCLCCHKDGNELPNIFPPKPIILTGYQNNQALIQVALTEQSDKWRKESKIEIKNLTGADINGLTFHIEGCENARTGADNCKNIYTYEMKSGEKIASEKSIIVTTGETFFYTNALSNNLYITKLSPLTDGLKTPSGFYKSSKIDYTTPNSTVSYFGEGRCFITIDNEIVIRYNLYNSGSTTTDFKHILGKIVRTTLINAHIDPKKATDTFEFLTGKIQAPDTLILSPDNNTVIKSIKVTLN
jgi:hypothetical protein